MLMKNDTEQMRQVNTGSVWTDEKPAKTAVVDAPGVKLAVGAAVVTATLATIGTIWAYLSGLRALHSVAAQFEDAKGRSAQGLSQVVSYASHWALVMVLITILTCA